MENTQIILSSGEAVVVLPLRQYEQLKLDAGRYAALNRQGEEECDDDPISPEEEAGLARLADEQIALIKAGKTKLIPIEDIRKKYNLSHPIRSIREHRGLTAAALAKKAGVGRVTITHIENRARKGTVANYKAIAKALGVKVDSILDWSDR